MPAVLEQAVAHLGQVRRAADGAPAGSVLAVAERVALGDGRGLLRGALAASLPRRAGLADAARRKGAAAGPTAVTAAG